MAVALQPVSFATKLKPVEHYINFRVCSSICTLQLNSGAAKPTMRSSSSYCLRPVQACSPRAARSAAASVWLGSRRVSVSEAPVMGLVPLVASQASMAWRSYLRWDEGRDTG